MRFSSIAQAILVAGVLSLGRAQWASGQDRTPARSRLTLEGVYQRLDTAAPMLASVRAAARAAEARIAPAGTLPDPMLELGTVNRDLRSGGLMDFSGMNMVGIRQAIPLAGRLGLAGALAKARAQTAAGQTSATRWELRLEAAMAYADLFAADRAVEVLEDTRRLVSGSGRAVEAMYAVGQGRQADVLRAQTELSRMDEEIIRMQSMRRQMAARLSALIDLPLDPDTLAIAAPPSAVDTPGLDSLLALAVTARPALATARASVAAARAAERLARREIWPDLEVGLQYGWRPMTGTTDHMLSITVGASVPIFAGRRQLQMRREAAAMTDMATNDARAVEAETRGRVREAWARRQEAIRLAALYRTALVPQAQATLESADAAYRVGAVDYMTLLDNQMTLNRYRQELYRIEATASQALATLEFLTGSELVPRSGPVEKE